MSTQLSNGPKILQQLVLVLVLTAAIIALILYLISLNPVVDSRSVTFRVETSGGFSIITLDAGSLKIPTATTVTTPWQRTVQIPVGTAVYLTAANPTQTGSITCSISLDLQVWKKEKTTAPKDGVACAGIVP